MDDLNKVQQNNALLGTIAKRDLFEQQCREHEQKAAQDWESPIVGASHALLAAAMRAKLIQYDLLKKAQEAKKERTEG
jgi:hypothetical protein